MENITAAATILHNLTVEQSSLPFNRLLTEVATEWDIDPQELTEAYIDLDLGE